MPSVVAADEILPSDPPSHPKRIGRYDVLRWLGAGGMGVVYAAHDPEVDRDLAVKLLRADRVGGSLSAASERLRREAQITAKLAHPNVVTIYDVGRTTDGSVYVAMELVDGPSFQQWAREVARPWREILGMYFQAGLGLAAAHRAGLVHRDFKPGNVLVADRRARVVDFGLASVGPILAAGDSSSRFAGDPATKPGDLTTTFPGDPNAPIDAAGNVSLGAVTLEGPEDTLVRGPGGGGELASDESLAGQTVDGDSPVTHPTHVSGSGAFAGTPAYMAPELLTGAGADARSDQFAYCVALYEALYGERPFAGDTVAALVAEVLAGRIRAAPPRTRVPRWVRSIVVRGLAVEPDDRYPTLHALLAALAFTSRIMWE